MPTGTIVEYSPFGKAMTPQLQAFIDTILELLPPMNTEGENA